VLFEIRTISVRLLVICVVLLEVMTGSLASAQNPMTVEQSLSGVGFAELAGVEFSPDGQWLAYTTKDYRRARTVDLASWARSGVRDVFTGSDVWIVNVRTSQLLNLTGGQDDNFMPAWSPDGRQLAFLSDRDGSGQAKLWIWDATRGQIRKLSDLKVRQLGQIAWTHDSRRIIVPVVPEDMSLDGYVTQLTSVAPESADRATTTQGATAVLYQSRAQGLDKSLQSKADAWNLNWYLRDLASVDVFTGQTTIVVRGKRVAHFLLSPDGSRLAYTIAKRFEKPGSQQTIFDLAATILSTGKERIAASDIRLDFDGTFSWSPDGASLGYRAFGPEERVFDCYIATLSDAKPRNITNLGVQSQWPRNTSTGILWDSNQTVYFITNGVLWQSSVTTAKAIEVASVPGHSIVSLIPASDNSLWTTDGRKSTIVAVHDDAGKQDGFYRVDLVNHTSAKLVEAGQCYTCANSDRSFAVTPDGQYFVYFAEDAQHDADLWISDGQFALPRQLTHLNPQFEEHKQGAARLVNWFSDDGEPLQGALLLPSDYVSGKRYPLVVWVYGGASLSNHFDHFGLEGLGPFNMQLLAMRGYAVLAPDSHVQVGSSMLDLVKTVLPGVNKVIEMGVADPDRLGIMGHSFGAYSALALIVQTARFKAAVVVDGFGDLIGSYGGMDKTGAVFGVSIGEEEEGGTPWQFRERYVENSPIFYLDKVGTPVLLIHGSADSVVPPFLDDEIFAGLRRLGKEADYVKYEGEGHAPPYWSYANQVDFCNRVIAWLDTHLGKANPVNDQ